jgi:hypothetical protein
MYYYGGYQGYGCGNQCGYGGGYGYGGSEWIWIVIVLFILLFIVFGNNRGGCGCYNNQQCGCNR